MTAKRWLIHGALVPAMLAGACHPGGEAPECIESPDCPAGEACVDGLCAPDSDAGASGGIDVTTGEPMTDLPVPQGAASCEEVELFATHAGCRFWAVDLPNAWEPAEPFGLDIAADQQFAVVVTNVTHSEAAEVVVYLGRDTVPVASASVEPGEVHTFELPAANFDPTQNGAAKAYRVESDLPIAAYQFQPLGNNVPVYSNDASALFPEHVLGEDYIAVTGDAMRLEMYPDGWDPVVYNTGAFVTIVATAADTHVKLYPTAGLLAPPVKSLTLHRGDAFTVLSDLDNLTGSPSGDLSGTRVVADRPIAVFGGSVTANVPFNNGTCCADHLEHQMMPLSAWGNGYVVAPPPSVLGAAQAAPALYRLTGAFDHTELEWPAGAPEGAPSKVHASQTVVFQTDRPFVVRSVDPEQSFALTQFLLSAQAADPTDSGLGDPAMTVIPAAAQMQRNYTFLVPEGYQDNYVTIIAPGTAAVTLDGDDVELRVAAGALGGVGYVYGNVLLAPGTHEVSASEPVGITVVGYDQWVSYAYTGGSGILAISDLPPTP